MQPAADQDFVAEVKFDSVPTARYQSQGLIVQQDGDDWLRFNVHSNGSSLRAYASTTVAGVSTKRIDLNTPAGGASWLRVERAGDTWTLRTSTNGTTWRNEGSFTHAVDVTAVGPFAGNSGSPAPAFTALVDYVFEAASPLVPEDTPGTSPSTTTSTSTTTTGPSTTTSTTTPPPAGQGPSITAWYGDNQVFGANGQSQNFANVLGNVSDPQGVAALSYTVNGGASRQLTVGPDLRRLQFPGDFNADIPWSTLSNGSNAVVITARDGQGNVSTRTVTVVKQSGDAPLPYTTDWSEATRINDQAQVVDGNWRLDGDTIRPTQMGYDRLVMLGDISWHDYEMTVPVTVHGLGPGNGSQNSGNSLVGFALNWRGHTQTSTEQPFRYWYPTGALGWYRWYQPTPKFELRGNNDTPVVRHNRFHLQFGTTYVFKARSDTVAGGIEYSWKVWPQGQPEPAAWDLTFTSNSGPATGSIALISHHSDVQFGNVTVTSIP